jgi:AraC family transcriptional regulator of adaptative response/methylated-DNA-[protein]-cysteine methyltransferase
MDRTINSQLSQDYEKIGQAIRYLEVHQVEQPGLADLANALHLSEYHLQRLFSRWVGISPKRFMQYLTKEHAKHLLDQSRDVLNTAHSVGLSGPGRLHDMFITCEAMTPGEYKSRGAGLKIGYGIHPSPFGDCLVGVTQRGICSLIFLCEGDRAEALASLVSSWPAAQIEEDQAVTAEVATGVQTLFRDEPSNPMRIYLNGSNFQIKVWEALMQIPAGSVASYQQVAVQIGMPGASRAVGNALARNPIPVLIPCHRVIRDNGEFGEYRYGTVRKKAILGYEMAKSAPAQVAGPG